MNTAAPELNELIRLIVEDARAEGATDVHLNPTPSGMRLRYRVDGRLRLVRDLPASLAGLLPSALADRAGLDQEGAGWCQGNVRISSLRSVLGTNLVLRLAESRAVPHRLEELGLPNETMVGWRRALKRPWGLLLITGPTGSGKTASAYASLPEAGGSECNVMTVEDPVESVLDWAVQVPVREDLDFPAALRAIYSQDPDVVFCAEVREGKTATMLCQLALTGHVAIACMHAPDATGALYRLVSAGVPASMVGSAVGAVLAQRLVRKVCPHCRDRRPATDRESAWLAEEGLEAPLEGLCYGRGCERCMDTGYLGRTGAYHLLEPTEGLIRALYSVEAREAGPEELRAEAAEAGLGSLRREAFRLAAEGVTTLEEADWATRLEGSQKSVLADAQAPPFGLAGSDREPAGPATEGF